MAIDYEGLQKSLVEKKVPYRSHDSSLYIFDNKENRGYNQFQLNPDEVGHSNQNKIKYL